MEKRKCPRFPVMLPTVFFGERAGGGMVVDVSLEGSRIRSAVPMQKGDYVRIRIDLIGDSLTGDLAVVRWSRKEEFRCGIDSTGAGSTSSTAWIPRSVQGDSSR